MPITIDNNGEQQEVYTKEELEEKIGKAQEEASQQAESTIEEKVSAIKQESEEKISSLEQKFNDAQSALEEAQREDDEDGDDSEQVKRLRRERDEARNDLKEFKESTNERISDIEQNLQNSSKNQLIEKFAPNADEETRKKLELEFDNYKPEANNPEDREARMQVAARIVGVGQSEGPSTLDGVSGLSSNRGQGHSPEESAEVKENEKNIGKALGVSAEDIKKHKQEKSKNNQQ